MDPGSRPIQRRQQLQQLYKQPQTGQTTPSMNFQQPSNIQPTPPSNPAVRQRLVKQQNQNVKSNPINQASQSGPPELTKEDNTWINERAAEMARGFSRDEMNTIVASMDPRILQSLQEKKIDPIIYHFRMKATKEFRVNQAQEIAMVEKSRKRTRVNDPAISVDEVEPLTKVPKRCSSADVRISYTLSQDRSDGRDASLLLCALAGREKHIFDDAKALRLNRIGLKLSKGPIDPTGHIQYNSKKS